MTVISDDTHATIAGYRYTETHMKQLFSANSLCGFVATAEHFS